MIDELYALIDDYYLNQPAALVWVWPTSVLANNFRNASSPANASLLLDAGSFYIDRYDGLVSQPEDLNYDDGDMNGEELAFAILGALLEEDSGSKSGGKNIGTGGRSRLAQEHISREFTNAFAFDFVIRGENAD